MSVYLISTLVASFIGSSVIHFASATPADAPVPRACYILPPPCPSPGPRTSYYSIPCFPSTGPVCPPTDFYAAEDIGQYQVGRDGTIDSTVNTRCRAKCDSQSQCLSYVGIENISPNGLATATCFYYSAQFLSYRRCFDPPSRNQAYYKQKLCPTTTTSTTSSAAPQTTTCNSAQRSFCTSQTRNTCLCQIDTDGTTPICSTNSICPQSTFPNPPPPCGSDADCARLYPNSEYKRCVYADDLASSCSPTYCASENGCNQQYLMVMPRGLKYIDDE